MRGVTKAQLPQGTVTFAFTDIEGSTSLLKRLGDEYTAVLRDHRLLIREIFGAHNGVEIDTQGDAFFYAFSRAGDAVAAAAAAQRAHAEHPWPQGSDVRVRIGLHTGEPILGEDGYVGLDVVRAARLCGECRGGQVLLSSVTKALAGSRLPEGVDVFRLGERHLKDIDEPEVVYQLEIRGVAVTPSRPGRTEPATSGQTASSATTPGPAAADLPASLGEQDADRRFEDRINAFAARAKQQILDQVMEQLDAEERAAQGADDADLDAMAHRNKQLPASILRGLVDLWRNPPGPNS
jgi:class 3 adenylate cyclase